jgi:serine/threonine-protein kinase
LARVLRVSIFARARTARFDPMSGAARMATFVWFARHVARFACRRAFVTLAATWILSAGIGTHAQAQSTAADKAAAEALFDRGLALLKEGKYQEACERLEQSQVVERGIGTMLYLAECYEKIGRNASAWALFREAASTAQAAGQAERAEAGRRRAEKLEKGLSRLSIQVPASSRIQGLVVQDNGSALQAAVWGVALPVDPGVHRVEASAPGYTPWSGEVRVDDRAGNAEISVPALVKDPNAVVAAVPTASETAGQAGTSGPVTMSRSAQPSGPERMSTLRIVGIALGAAGIVGIVVGAATGGVAMSKQSDYEKATKDNDGKCPDDKCVSQSKAARSMGNVSTAMWAVGGALLAGGLVTFFVAPKYQQKKADIALYADPRGAGMRVGGVF